MVKWRVERGVVQQTEALVRGFYEVSVRVWLAEIAKVTGLPCTLSRKIRNYEYKRICLFGLNTYDLTLCDG